MARLMRLALCSALLLLCYLVQGIAAASTPSIEDRLRNDPDLSQFYALLERNPAAASTLRYRRATVFAPTNRAFQRYPPNISETVVLYHITTEVRPLDQLGNWFNSDAEGNPPLWVTMKKMPHKNEIFVNNARIIQERSNLRCVNTGGYQQVLHVVDDVLLAVARNPSVAQNAAPIGYPNAYNLIESFEQYDLNPHRLRHFRDQVKKNKRAASFSIEGGHHTFFIPIDEGFVSGRDGKMDDKVIDGHVIPDKVLFTSSTPLDVPYETLAFGDNMKVTITFSKEDDEERQTQIFVTSDTLIGDSKHPSGKVIAQIVRANIPVKNGVVHLIQRPLMVVDQTVKQFLEDKDNGPVKRFYEVMMDLKIGRDLMDSFGKTPEMTVFVPSNNAWNNPLLKNMLRDEDKMRELINMHIVRERLTVDKISRKNQNQLYQVPTRSDKHTLYFNVVNLNGNMAMTVEGGGVNATVVQANIAATNGIVHIIDRVLGVPYTTVLDKLRTDPMLNDTYFLGQRRDFNRQLNDSERKYTYFVPRDKAWRRFETNSAASVVKLLFMPEYSYQAVQVLEKHLIVSDVPFTMERLKLMANSTYNKNEILLRPLRDELRIRIEETRDKIYTIHWNNQQIGVVRPDVICTNGVIHVIDWPFLDEMDIVVNGAVSVMSFLPHVLMLVLAKLFLV